MPAGDQQLALSKLIELNIGGCAEMDALPHSFSNLTQLKYV